MAQTQGQRVVREYIQKGHIERTLQAMPIAANKLRVAAYCRVSSDDEEQLHSYKAQVEYYTAYIKSKPEWEYAGTYADEGITGTKLKKRAEFNRLIQDALDGKINIILTKSVSRFARNTLDSIGTIRALRDKNVKVIFEKENIDSLDPKCDMILSIYSSLAEEESRSISTNVRWANNKKVERGEVVFNFNNLYGYMQNAEKVVSIKEDEAEIVREVYHKYIIGYSITEICRELNAGGVDAPCGKRWHFETVNKMLMQEKYQGNVILRKTYARDFLAERRVKNTGQVPQKFVENNHPAIVDKATWDAAQAEMERRGNLRTSEESGKGRYDMRYPFSGIIECGECGSTFRRHNHIRRNADPERVWVCKEHVKGKKYCKQLAVKEEMLEQAFVRTFNGLLTDRSNALKIVEQSVAEAMFEAEDGTGTAEEIAAVDAEIERLQAQMIDLNKQRARREIDGEVYNGRTQYLKEKLDALFEKRDDLSEAQSSGALSQARRKMIADLLGNESEQTEFDKDVFTKTVEVIRVYGRDDITFIFKDGTEVKADLSSL